MKMKRAMQVAISLIPGRAYLRFAVALAILAVGVAPAFADQFIVDCTGATPGAYTSINAALSVAGPDSMILVTGPCTENVYLSGKTNLFLGAWWGQAANVYGTVNISNSQGVYLYGLNVSNSFADGIFVFSSRSLVLDSCTSNSNSGIGLNAATGSQIAIFAPSAFNNNAHKKINVSSN